jgi:VanZ family protein
MRLSLFYLLPIAFWMVVIFGFSGDSSSFQHSSRILEPLLHWLFPHIADANIKEIVFAVRKGAHVTEYAVLALLVWRVRRKISAENLHAWHWRMAGETLWFAALYAATDEFHQTFVPSREGCLRDVIIDTTGAAVALVLLWRFGRWRKYW